MHKYDQIKNLLSTSTFFYAIAIGMDSVYSYVSPNYNRNFSVGKGTLEGEHYSITLHPEDVQICEVVGMKCFEAPEQLFPATLRKHDGKGGFVITQWEMQAIMNDSGSPQGIFCIGHNITEFVDTQAKLGQAETHLDEINFIQSHGVRKPLANIMGITKLLENTADEGERKELMRMMNKSADELDHIIKEISDKKI